MTMNKVINFSCKLDFMVPSQKCEQLRLLVLCFHHIDKWIVVFLWGRGSLWALGGCDSNDANMYQPERSKCRRTSKMYSHSLDIVFDNRN